MASTSGPGPSSSGPTDIIDPPGEGADQGVGDSTGGPVPPAAASYGWPTWIRRSIITVALLGCAGLIVWANGHSDAGKTPKDPDPVIVSQFPPQGGQAPRQTPITVELKPGYDGRLTINGIAIPESEMDQARDPATVDPKDLAQNGLRPNNHNHVSFAPGPGKVIEQLPSGPVYASVHYFPDHRSPSLGRTISWTFDVD